MPWRHRKTGGLYEVVTRAFDERTVRPVMVYRSLQDGRVWARDLAEFLDGRFVDLNDWRPEDTRALLRELYPPKLFPGVEQMRESLAALGQAAASTGAALVAVAAAGLRFEDATARRATEARAHEDGELWKMGLSGIQLQAARQMAAATGIPVVEAARHITTWSGPIATQLGGTQPPRPPKKGRR